MIFRAGDIVSLYHQPDRTMTVTNDPPGETNDVHVSYWTKDGLLVMNRLSPGSLKLVKERPPEGTMAQAIKSGLVVLRESGEPV